MEPYNQINPDVLRVSKENISRTVDRPFVVYILGEVNGDIFLKGARALKPRYVGLFSNDATNTFSDQFNRVCAFYDNDPLITDFTYFTFKNRRDN